MRRIDFGTDLAADPASVVVRKLPVPVQVQWMSEDGNCATLEGVVSYRAGDPLLTGIDGEQWTMPATAFAASYEPELPLAFGQDGCYRKKPLEVRALRLEHAAQVRLRHGAGVLSGQAGDWLVQYGPGNFGIVAAAIFARTYQVGDSGGDVA